MQSFRGKLPARSTRVPCGAGFGVILVSIFSKSLSSCTARHKEEDDRWCCVSLCFKITQFYDCFVRLSNLHCYFCDVLCQYFDLEKLIKAK